jgi:hypothetical protein
MFKRVRHQQIAIILEALDQDLLRDHMCFFGGGTAIAMGYGEYRQSDDIDFMVSNWDRYRELRGLVKLKGPKSLFQKTTALELPETFLIDQYGIRGWVRILGEQIKFEIVSEGRIELEAPSSDDQICGVSTLTQTDMVAEKVLANSDRFLDTATFQRDLFDLAAMNIPDFQNSPGLEKARQSYGETAQRDLNRALERLLGNPVWLDQCYARLQITTPRAVMLKALKKLATPTSSDADTASK